MLFPARRSQKTAPSQQASFGCNSRSKKVFLAKRTLDLYPATARCTSILDQLVMRAYLQLVRLPAVFTAMADILLGWLAVHRSLDDGAGQFALLVVASSCLYLAGMALNDVFDRDVDARERPSRPIPSGKIPLRNAVLLAVALIGAGIGCAATVGLPSLVTAGLIVVGILLYDGVLKSTPAGPLAMGACRFLNVILGASFRPDLAALWQPPSVWVAAAMGIYIVGVTWFARQEAGVSRGGQLALAAVVINAGLVGAIVLASYEPAGLAAEKVRPLRLVFPWLIVALIINRRVTAACLDPQPQKVQYAVRIMLLSLVMLDAILVFAATADPVYALATAALIAPAMLVGRWLYMT